MIYHSNWDLSARNRLLYFILWGRTNAELCKIDRSAIICQNEIEIETKKLSNEIFRPIFRFGFCRLLSIIIRASFSFWISYSQRWCCLLACLLHEKTVKKHGIFLFDLLDPKLLSWCSDKPSTLPVPVEIKVLKAGIRFSYIINHGLIGAALLYFTLWHGVPMTKPSQTNWKWMTVSGRKPHYRARTKEMYTEYLHGHAAATNRFITGAQ